MSVRSLNNTVPLLALRDAALELGSRLIFQKANIYISRNDKTCLVGRNGSGKSTLLKALAGALELDRGDRFIKPGTVVKYLSQEPDFKYDQTAWEYVKNGLKEEEFDQPNFRIDSMLSELRLDGDRKVATLSGGEARRAALAKVFISKPDILLLDEPTNHLDLHTIEWLEAELRNFKGGFLLVSHDRAFLRNLSNSMYWIDRTLVRKHEKGFNEFVDWSEKIIKEFGKDFLISQIKNFDPNSLKEVNNNDTVRLRRIWEVYEATGKKLSEWRLSDNKKFLENFNYKIFLFLPDRKKNYDIVNSRFISMIDKGAVEEVKKLLTLHLNRSLPIMRAHGVPEIEKYLDNEISLEECINKGQQVTRNYVKRQHTWWKSSKLEIFQKFDQFPSEIDINSIKIN